MKQIMKLKLCTLAIGGLLLVNGCNNASNNSKIRIEETHSKVQYTCSMHPEVVRDESGSCAKCGMALIEKKEVEHSSHSHE